MALYSVINMSSRESGASAIHKAHLNPNPKFLTLTLMVLYTGSQKWPWPRSSRISVVPLLPLVPEQFGVKKSKNKMNVHGIEP